MSIKCNVPNDQLSAEEWQVIESRMYPDGYSQTGFLQAGEKLSEVIDNDAKFLQSVSITYDQIADRLETIVGKYNRILNLATQRREKLGQVIVELQYEIEEIAYMGAQECPFQNKKLDNSYHGYEYGSSDITVRNIITNKSFTFNTLLLHLIRAHRFFESPKSSHRLDPGQVIEVLEIKPNVNYTPRYKSYQYWQHQGSCNCNNSTQKEMQLLMQIALKTYVLDKNVIAFLLPTNKHEYKWRKMAESIVIDNSLTYESILPQLCQLELESLKNCMFSKDKSLPSLEELISKEMEVISKYRTTGKLDSLTLYVYAFREINETFIIENVKCHIERKVSSFMLRVRKYVPID